MRTAHALLVLLLCTPIAAIADSQPRQIDIPTRMNGAQRVVVATADAVQAQWRQNAYGDRLIVSTFRLRVEETLKGASAPAALMEVEGGTLGGMTLRVSDMPELKPGDRAVFFLDRVDAPVQVPHLRGLGILLLDADQVRGTTMTLQDIRRAAPRLP